MIKKNNILYLIIFLILIVVLLLPVKYPTSINLKGKLLPYKTWVLSKGLDGRLLTSLTDNLTGIDTDFSVSEFVRGDAVQFKLNSSLISKKKISLGDTIGYIISNEIDQNIEKLKGDLKTAKASLKVITSSEKESVIEEEKRRLDFAEKELDEQTKIFNRKLLLFERDLISRQEFEADEAAFELAKININIAKERLRTVQSGAKKEEIIFAEAQINALENEILVLQKRYESNNIISPISGIVNQIYSTDSLLVINDTSQFVVIVPVKWSESKSLLINQKALISHADVNETINGLVVSIGNSVNTANNIQYVLVTILTQDKIYELKPGLYVDCKIETESQSALKIAKNFIGNIF